MSSPATRSTRHDRGGSSVRELRPGAAYGWILWACLVLTAFTVPFESATSIALIGSMPRLLGGVTIIVFVVSLAQRHRCFTVPAFARLLFLYVMFALLSLAWVTPEADSQRRITLLLQLALLATLVVQVARTQRERAILAAAYGLGALVAAGVVISNKLAGRPFDDQSLELGVVVTRYNVGHVARFTIGIEDPNYVGMILVLGIPMALWGFRALWSRRGLFAAMAISPPIALAALLTGSRGSTVVAPMLAVAYIIVSRVRRHFGRMLLALGGAGLAGLAVWRQLPVDTQYRLKTGLDSSQSTSKLRTLVWRAGYHAFLRRPVQGYGIGSYRFVVRDALSRNLVAHNTFINVAVEFGIIGLSLVLAMFATVWRRSAALPDAERLTTRSTLLLLMGSASFISADLKKVTFFVFALLVATVINRDPLDHSLSVDSPRRGRRRRDARRPLPTRRPSYV